MRRFPAIAAAVTLLAAPAAALAGGGNSSVDQYTEHVPTAGGGDGGQGGGGNGGGGAIPQATRQSLANEGSAGQAAANLAESSAPPVHRAAHAGNRSGSGSGAAGTDSPGVIRARTDAVGHSASAGGGGGIGVGLPIILGVCLLGAIAVAVLRRRGNPPAA